VCVDLEDWHNAQSAVKSLGSLDLLVNNAAVSEITPFTDVTVESFDRQVVVLFTEFNGNQLKAGLHRQTDRRTCLYRSNPSPQLNAKCDVVMKLSVFGTQTDTHTLHKAKPIHPRYAGCNYLHPRLDRGGVILLGSYGGSWMICILLIFPGLR